MLMTTSSVLRSRNQGKVTALKSETRGSNRGTCGCQKHSCQRGDPILTQTQLPGNAAAQPPGTHPHPHPTVGSVTHTEPPPAGPACTENIFPPLAPFRNESLTVVVSGGSSRCEGVFWCRIQSWGREHRHRGWVSTQLGHKLKCRRASPPSATSQSYQQVSEAASLTWHHRSWCKR